MRGMIRGGVLLVAMGLGWQAGYGQADQKPAGRSGPDGRHASRDACAGSGRAAEDHIRRQSAEWTPEKLAALPHITIKLYNEHAKADQTYSGVPLMELLKPLGVPEKPNGKDFTLYLVAEGSDGYKVVYSIGEAMPDVHDGTVLVADAMDGKPLGANGPVQLVATGEKRPARWVRNLVAIRVKTAE